MKKSIFIIAAMFAAMFAKAQITLEHTFDGWVDVISSGSLHPSSDAYYFSVSQVESPYYYLHDKENNQVKFYDKETYNLYKITNLPTVDDLPLLVCKDIFTTNGKISLIANRSGKIIDEDGVTIYDFVNDNCVKIYYVFLEKINGNYKLLVQGADASTNQSKSYIYSLPGNGETTSVSNPSPKRNARKIAREGQVLVETENNTYTLQGQEVK